MFIVYLSLLLKKYYNWFGDIFVCLIHSGVIVYLSMCIEILNLWLVEKQKTEKQITVHKILK